MESLIETLAALQTWGTLFGLVFGALGFGLFFVGVKEQMGEAQKISAFAANHSAKVTGDTRMERAVSVRDLRAKERKRAKTMVTQGLIYIVIGFCLYIAST
jgi:hypothetical protein